MTLTNQHMPIMLSNPIPLPLLRIIVGGRAKESLIDQGSLFSSKPGSLRLVKAERPQESFATPLKLKSSNSAPYLLKESCDDRLNIKGEGLGQYSTPT